MDEKSVSGPQELTETKSESEETDQDLDDDTIIVGHDEEERHPHEDNEIKRRLSRRRGHEDQEKCKTLPPSSMSRRSAQNH